MSSPSSLASGIRDNFERGAVGEFLRQNISADSELAIVSAYFTIYAYEKLKTQLDAIAQLRFLFGEPSYLDLDPSQRARKAFDLDQDGLRVRDLMTLRRTARVCAEWIAAKVEIRSVKRAGLLHGKLYHINNHGVHEAILGSSNFTVRGLGLADDGKNNIELNLIVNDRRDRDDLKQWFDELWDNTDYVADVKQEVLASLAQIYADHDPQFIYYKTLYHLFREFVDAEERDERLVEQRQLPETLIWNALFQFQKDAVKGALNKIRKHNGCIIADSVGLGKTYEALAVIKYFELLNQRVLVLCPKKLSENWLVYKRNDVLNPFERDRFRYDVLAHTDLSRERGMSGDINLETIKWGNYDLVVLDESHNFRNNTRGRRDEEGNVIAKSRYERLMEDVIQRGIQTKVLMLSATPVNTDLTDLKNQIMFITENDDAKFRESMNIGSVDSALRNAQKEFNAWAKERVAQRALPTPARQTDELVNRLDASFFKLLDELTIARSRQHITTYYQESDFQRSAFPQRRAPHSVYPAIDSASEFMSYDHLNDEILKYKLALFNPSQYLLPEYRAQYEAKPKRAPKQFTQSQREHYLIGMMKVNFLKRLESSIRAFEITMARTLDKMEELQQRIERFETTRRASEEITTDDLEIDAADDAELGDAFEVGKAVKYKLAHLDLEAWKKDLAEDYKKISELYSAARVVEPARDAKLAELKTLLQNKFQQPTTNKAGEPNRKVLVFTAFADTAIYLYQELHRWARDEMQIHAALVTGGGDNRATFGGSEFNTILTNFSPRSKKRAQMQGIDQSGEIDLLIATDCISEGQNLQDCDRVVNYDIHWNPVRVIQRFGRIDRIGSANDWVQMVNFWPTPDLDRYIDLKTRVEARMALVDVAATGTDNPLDLETQIQDDLRFRDQQLKRLQNETLDLEELNDSVSFSDFTLDDFRLDLLRFIQSNRAQLERAEMGLYAVVPPVTFDGREDPRLSPGVIFCLKQRGDIAGEKVNPLAPYFLVYVREDKTVRFTFAQPKQILELYRELCLDRTEPLRELCREFDRRTQDGAEMSLYNALLDSAVASIERTFARREAQQLTTRRDAVLTDRARQPTQKTDFELVTWLIIV